MLEGWLHRWFCSHRLAMQLSIAVIRLPVHSKRFEALYPPTPGGDRALIGIATFDSAVQFYALRPGQSAPQMLVVPDILEPYAPSASSLLLNAQEARGLVSTGILLQSLTNKQVKHLTASEL